jgi:hypothetical protein
MRVYQASETIDKVSVPVYDSILAKRKCFATQPMSVKASKYLDKLRWQLASSTLPSLIAATQQRICHQNQRKSKIGQPQLVRVEVPTICVLFLSQSVNVSSF